MLVHRNCEWIGVWAARSNSRKGVCEGKVGQFEGGSVSGEAGISGQRGSALRLGSFSHGEPGIVDLRSEVETERTADNELFVRLPRDAKTRLEVVIDRLDQPATVGRVGRSGHRSRIETVCADIDVGIFVVILRIRCKMIPSNTEVEGKNLAYRPIVLKRVGVNEAGDIGASDCRVDAVPADVAEQKIEQRGASVAAIERKGAMRVAGLTEVVSTAADVDAKLHEVVAALPREIVNELVDTVGSIAGANVTKVAEQPIGLSRTADGRVDAAEKMRIGGRKRNAEETISDVVSGIVRRSKGFELLEILA